MIVANQVLFPTVIWFVVGFHGSFAISCLRYGASHSLTSLTALGPRQKEHSFFALSICVLNAADEK